VRVVMPVDSNQVTDEPTTCNAELAENAELTQTRCSAGSAVSALIVV
jgi:hypothetical protein